MNGIKRKLLATRKMIEIDKEIAAGIHVYSLEELGKLSLLENAPKEDNYRIINYSSQFMCHGYKFKLLSDHLKKVARTDCNKITKGSFSPRSFSQHSFTMDTFADTQARLGIFYIDLDYSSNSDIAKGIKKIPSVDIKTLRKAIDCLQDIIDEWQS
jgi:hypothetical protein